MWTKEWGQVNPRTHNLYLYVQNDPLNNIDPSGHVLQMGTSGNQPATLWGNCTLCRNDGRNVPANRTHCARCTRPRIVVCRECGRQGCRGQCMTPARNAPLPPSSGNNNNQRANGANGAGHKHNSSLIPGYGTTFFVCWRRTTYDIRILNSRLTRFDRDPRTCDTTFALEAIVQTLAGGARVPAEIALLVDLYFRDEITLEGLGHMIVGLRIPGWFAIEEQLDRLVDVTMAYKGQIEFRFRFTGDVPRNAPGTVVHDKPNRSLRVNRMRILNERLALREMERQATDRLASLVRTIYRDALRL